MQARMALATAGLSFAALAAATSLAAAGSVAGKIELPPGDLELPSLGRAFLPRLENPHAPRRMVDPLPSMVVVLEPAAGVEVPPPKATTVTWELLGDSFARPLMAARLGSPIELRNSGPSAPVIVVVGQPALLAKKPLNPTDRVAIEPKQAGLIDLVDETTPYLRGRALVVDKALFAFPDAAGKFTFDDVPAGDWTVRVYYAPRNVAMSNPKRPGATPTPAGWIDRTDDKITVGAKRVDVPVKLPPALPVKP
jgi:hypothetical protein